MDDESQFLDNDHDGEIFMSIEIDFQLMKIQLWIYTV